VIVVADASPLRYLILIDYAHVLTALYGRVVVPPAVVAELNQQRTPDVVRSWLAGAPEWLHVQAPIQGREDLRRGLGAGEREAIALAAELSADALLVDDRDARREADKLGIPVLGTLRVLATRRSTVSAISRSHSTGCGRGISAPVNTSFNVCSTALRKPAKG